jgi:uncharacterized protein YkwD
LKAGTVTIRLLTVAVLSTLVLSTSVTTAHSGTCWRYRRLERKMSRKVNKARRHHGLPRIVLDRHLSRVSRVHTHNMVKRQTLFHTPARVLARRVTRWVSLGENVGHTPRGVHSLFRSFMRSAGHRANILSSAFNHIGVGTRKKRGRLWVTLTFQAHRNPGTRLDMPRC